MSGVKYLLDTNIIIGLYQRNPIVLDLLKTKRVKIGRYTYSPMSLT